MWPLKEQLMYFRPLYFGLNKNFKRKENEKDILYQNRLSITYRHVAVELMS